MTDTLLFLHLLSAAALVAAVVAFSAAVLGARLEPSPVQAFLGLWRIGLLGVVVFGLALAIDIDAYHPWDAWVVIAIVLWLAVGAMGERAPKALKGAGDGSATIPADVVRSHWIQVALVVLLLADMIWKPWA